jgi:hypothetical protein
MGKKKRRHEPVKSKEHRPLSAPQAQVVGGKSPDPKRKANESGTSVSWEIAIRSNWSPMPPAFPAPPEYIHSNSVFAGLKWLDSEKWWAGQAKIAYSSTSKIIKGDSSGRGEEERMRGP